MLATYLARPCTDNPAGWDYWWEVVALAADGGTYLIERSLPRNDAKWVAADRNDGRLPVPRGATLLSRPQLDLFAL